MADSIPNNMKMRILSCTRGYYWFFNEKGILSIISENCDPMEYGLKVIREETTRRYSDGEIQRTLLQMRSGDTYEKFRRLMRGEHLYSDIETSVDDFICKIYRPDFVRSAENEKENTFDFIYVDVSILSKEVFPGRDKFIQKHGNEIGAKVLAKLERLKIFKKYGVPISSLQISRMTLIQKCNMLQIAIRRQAS